VVGERRGFREARRVEREVSPGGDMVIEVMNVLSYGEFWLLGEDVDEYAPYVKSVVMSELSLIWLAAVYS
jgi:hypothetical protein